MAADHRTTRTRDIASGAVDDRPFRFFDLPRELRNAVYRYAINQDTLPYDFHGAQPAALLSGECYAPALLVCRQFKNEYEEETYRYTRLTISSSDAGCLLLEEMRDASSVTSSMRLIQHLTLRVRMYYRIEKFGFPQILQRAQGDLPLLLTLLPALCTLKVEFEIDDTDLDDMLTTRKVTSRQLHTTQVQNLFTPQPLVTDALLDGRNIRVAHEVIVDGWMYEVEIDGDDDATFYLMETDRNNIRCRAKLSDEPIAPYGMALEVIEASDEVDFTGTAEEHAEISEAESGTDEIGGNGEDIRVKWSLFATRLGLPEDENRIKPVGCRKRS